jgi:CBS domain-containing membrane protein
MTLPKWLGIELIEVSIKEKVIAACGGGLSIFSLIVFSYWALPVPDATAIVTSMAASAVLLFAVPHGPLSQPWPVLGGQGIAAAIGVACVHYISDPVVAAACAVGLTIGAMHQFKCIHPPGGATALAAVMGGDAIRDLGLTFVLFPVLTNALVMVLLAVLINSPFPVAALSREPECSPPSVASHREDVVSNRARRSPGGNPVPRFVRRHQRGRPDLPGRVAHPPFACWFQG